ncbi:Mu-like prophage protein gp16 [Fulvimarina pelagi HTCC2506]|uniref:Mu-like prophage protein gp16 n=1 Tax=Fulvimarina pelagi HTCC2506 TaxID=314231 RepID=Q0FYX3_9HYPH|nr:regulatory protein GemA [Fulvimarina pelagi]EAU40185.1 Mu-like prophage protein gp16 [Fulvimarina pelagi HTCC2506]
MSALAAIHVGKKQLGLDDDTYRDLLQRETGQRSAKDLTSAECDRVLGAMRRAGFKPGSNGLRKPLEGDYARKLQALWIALWNLGAVANRDDAALLAFAKRQCGIERTEWIRDPDDAKAVIEALKSWCEREGVVWTVSRRTYEVARQHGYHIAQAQWRKLTGQMITPAFWAAISEILKRTVTPERPPSNAEWQRVMNAFGKRLRLRSMQTRRAG